MSALPGSTPLVGMVAIGRNEGERLRRCLASCLRESVPVVYVDSGSTDGSLEFARHAGALVVELDLRTPFTAARARNAGFQALRQACPGLALVQFLDGDCVLDAGWLAAAVAAFDTHPAAVAVCGRRRELHPEASLYNRLCDIEWDTPVGPARACGGDVLMRTAALEAAGGYREDLIAGEEPELCVRLRAAGGEVWRIDADMTWHDADMHRWRQWWTRSVRAGHAFAEGAALHGQPPERHFAAETRRAVLWGGVLPLAALLVLPVSWMATLLLLLAYPLQFLRVGLRLRQQGRPCPWWQSLFFLQGRFAEARGVLKFRWGVISRRRSALIEYK